jgi:oligopeptide/dipeptide ABC transporter ATP-binding protein
MPETHPGGFEEVLRAENLCKQFGSLRAVDNINLSLRRGETMAIVGESGSGKSTLARLLLRLIEATTGTVSYRGRNLLALSAPEMQAARRSMQMIFQDPYASLHPLRMVADIISEPWRVHKGLVAPSRHGQEVEALLEQVGLPTSHARAYPARLSGGERQRVAIARAIALRPEVLILDEPVSALDVSVQAQVITLLMQLQQDLGMAYLFISHDLPLVRLVADRVAVMYNGRIVEEGPAADVFAAPVHPYTRLLLNASPDDPEPSLAVAVSSTVRAKDAGAGCSFRNRCSEAQAVCADVVPALSPTEMPGHSSACHFSPRYPKQRKLSA